MKVHLYPDETVDEFEVLYDGPEEGFRNCPIETFFTGGPFAYEINGEIKLLYGFQCILGVKSNSNSVGENVYCVTYYEKFSIVID